VSFYVSTATFFFAPLWRMGPRCSSAETQVCHRSYIIAATENPKKTTDLSQVTDKLYHIMLYTSRWLGFELTTSVVIGTYGIGSCKSNYHTITATTAPCLLDSPWKSNMGTGTWVLFNIRLNGIFWGILFFYFWLPRGLPSQDEVIP
jgi:hypothetical protein